MKKLLCLLLSLALVLPVAMAVEPEPPIPYEDVLQFGAEKATAFGTTIRRDGNDLIVEIAVDARPAGFDYIECALWDTSEDEWDGFTLLDSHSFGNVYGTEYGEVITTTLTMPEDMLYPARLTVFARKEENVGKPYSYEEDHIVSDMEFLFCEEGKIWLTVAPNLRRNTREKERWFNAFRWPVEIYPEVCALADEICEGAKTDIEKVKRIHDWIVLNFSYYYTDINQNSLYAAVQTLEARKGICGNYTDAFRLLLTAANIPNIRVSGYAQEESHTWNEVWVDGRWIEIDITWDESNIPGVVYYDNFDPKPKYFSSAHLTSFRGEGGGEPSQWAQDEIMQGYIATLYSSDLMSKDMFQKPITRKHFCYLMTRLVEAASGQRMSDYLAQQGVEAKEIFPDVEDDDNINALVALGLVKGKLGAPAKDARSDDHSTYRFHLNNADLAEGEQLLWFNQKGRITRQEAAVMLANCVELLGTRSEGEPRSFNDSDNIPGWARESVDIVTALSDNGKSVMGDTGGGNFEPKLEITYEEAMVAAVRLFHCLKQGQGE